MPTLPVPTTRKATSCTAYRASSGSRSSERVAGYASRAPATAAASASVTRRSTGAASTKRRPPSPVGSVDFAAKRPLVLARAFSETRSRVPSRSWASVWETSSSSAMAFQASSAGSLASSRMVRR